MITFLKNTNFCEKQDDCKYYVEKFETFENTNIYYRWTYLNENCRMAWIIRDKNDLYLYCVYPTYREFKDLELVYKHFYREEKLKRILE